MPAKLACVHCYQKWGYVTEPTFADLVVLGVNTNEGPGPIIGQAIATGPGWFFCQYCSLVASPPPLQEA